MQSQYRGNASVCLSVLDACVVWSKARTSEWSTIGMEWLTNCIILSSSTGSPFVLYAIQSAKVTSTQGDYSRLSRNLSESSLTSEEDEKGKLLPLYSRPKLKSAEEDVYVSYTLSCTEVERCVCVGGGGREVSVNFPSILVTPWVA